MLHLFQIERLPECYNLLIYLDCSSPFVIFSITKKIGQEPPRKDCTFLCNHLYINT